MSELTQFLISHGGLILFLVGFAEQNGLPLPGAPWLLAAGALSASGKFSLLAAIAWTAAGSVVADAVWYFLGQRGKERVFRVFPYLQSVQVRLARATLAKTVLHGMRMLTVAKFLPVGNSVVAMHAGALQVNRLRFLLVDAFSSVVYATVYASLGFAFHNQLVQLVAFLSRLSTVSLVVMAFSAGAYAVYHILNGRRKTVTATDKPPEESKTGANPRVSCSSLPQGISRFFVCQAGRPMTRTDPEADRTNSESLV
jgi:membrane protein DedA with SNARE-associated domain